MSCIISQAQLDIYQEKETKKRDGEEGEREVRVVLENGATNCITSRFHSATLYLFGWLVVVFVWGLGGGGGSFLRV